jgi:hypothetical protein
MERWSCPCAELIMHYARNTHGAVYVQINVFLTLALVGGEWSASRSRRLTPRTHFIGGSVGPRTGLDDVERRKVFPLPGLELRTTGRPARSQWLYWLRYYTSTKFEVGQLSNYSKKATSWTSGVQFSVGARTFRRVKTRFGALPAFLSSTYREPLAQW